MDELTPFDIVMAASDKVTKMHQQNTELKETKTIEDRRAIHSIVFWVFMAVATIVLS